MRLEPAADQRLRFSPPLCACPSAFILRKERKASFFFPQFHSRGKR